jgi:hypothetical protein
MLWFFGPLLGNSKWEGSIALGSVDAKWIQLFYCKKVGSGRFLVGGSGRLGGRLGLLRRTGPHRAAPSFY